MPVSVSGEEIFRLLFCLSFFSQKLMGEELYQGHTSCAGCPATIGIRHILKATGKNVIIANATSCSEIFSSAYPTTAWPVPYIHVAFECVASVASGIEAALKKQGKNTQVIAIAGDGGTFDIGLQALSGMVDRGHDILYVCYSNECYANTGIQRSPRNSDGKRNDRNKGNKQ